MLIEGRRPDGGRVEAGGGVASGSVDRPAALGAAALMKATALNPAFMVAVADERPVGASADPGIELRRFVGESETVD